MRLIDADALFRTINKIKCPQGACMQDGLADACQAVMDAPTIEAEPVRHGRWDYGKKHADFVEATCTACNGILLVKWYSKLSEYRYCPNCGAKMDKEEA